MRRYGLAGNVMLGFALAALGCAGSKGYQRYTAPLQSFHHFGHSTPTSTSGGDLIPPAPSESETREDAHEPPLMAPSGSSTDETNEIPPPPSFDQGEYLAPPQGAREPLTANTSSGLKRLRVPLKLQPITWRSLRQGEADTTPERQASPNQQFGHSLQAPR